MGNLHKNHLHVTCAIIERDGRVLSAKRSGTMSMAHKWEFPGGKVHGDETDYECLRREIMEELSIDVDVADLIFTVRYAYPEKEVVLKFYRAFYDGARSAIAPSENQSVEWVGTSELDKVDFVPADIPFAEFLQT